jgi:hypothetical protein
MMDGDDLGTSVFDWQGKPKYSEETCGAYEEFYLRWK